jgi:hypothetical protein
LNRQQIKEQAFAVVMKNRLIALYDRHAWAIFTDKADAMAFRRMMTLRGKECRVVKCEMTFSLPTPAKRKKMTKEGSTA